MSNVLSKICENRLIQVNKTKQAIPEKIARSNAENASKTRGFCDALKRKVNSKEFALIAEIKKASPSKGIIRSDFKPSDLAESYEAGGAACLSVLTEEKYFKGKPEHLIEARSKTSLPILRKDFIVDPYQVFESRNLGADCILIILAALEQSIAKDIAIESKILGMDILAEIHEESELERAILLSPDLIGINNRNLKTLDVDINTTIQLAPKVPKNIELVCESGIKNHSDLMKISKHGVNCFLVGESLMRNNDVKNATEELLGIVN
tara:strand:+ start:32467 stop:33264 length:798 start_codon:yes stop_codon:yes gene_type:complete